MTGEDKTTYNGWSNYETWAVHLWLTNDEGSYRYWTGRASEVLDDTAEGDDRPAPVLLADEIREAVCDQCEIEGRTLAADLMNAALGRVDWHEIAREFIDDHSPAEPTGEMLFSLGMVVATPGAIEGLTDADRAGALARHAAGDWGDVGPEDRAENERALQTGSRLLSVYRTGAGVAFWVVTEADRSVTTILLPGEH